MAKVTVTFQERKKKNIKMTCTEIKVFLCVVWILVYLHTSLHHIYVLNAVFLRRFSLFVFRQCQIITAGEVDGDRIILRLSFVIRLFVLHIRKHSWAVHTCSCQESDSASFASG